MGQLQPSGCYSAVQYYDGSGLALGLNILGHRTFPLAAALGTTLPTDANTCPPPAPYVIKPCPGAAPGTTCTPGTDALDGRWTGCCACRRTRYGAQVTMVYQTVAAVSYYGTTPNCTLAYRALPAATLVHFTGALVTGNPHLGCESKRYAEVVVELVQSTGGPLDYVPSWVLADSLIFCDPSRSCGAAVELGANCQAAGCCTVAAQGGHPAAECRFPPDVLPPSACVVPA